MAKVRVELTKGDEIRYISHLDYSRALERAIRRAKVPVAYSEGFNPHMKMAFASALAVGVTSDGEYMDLELAQDISPADLQNRLERQLPAGIRLKAARVITHKHDSLMSVVNLAAYTVTAPLTGSETEAAHAVAQFNQAAEVPYTKESPKGKRDIDVKRYMEEDIKLIHAGGRIRLEMAIHITPQGSVKPGEVLDALVQSFALPVNAAAALINRTGLFVQRDRQKLSPLNI